MKDRYFMTQKQMREARRIQSVLDSKLKRGDIEKMRNLYQCGCGCGVA
jgi:hypothetical protein